MSEKPKTQQETIEILHRLAQEDIARLEKMPQPIVRVCGPWTTGGWGLEENLKRYKAAVKALTERGYNVVDYFESEETIKTLGAEHETIMKEYHEPIMACGYIKEAFFMPKWNESKGTTRERNFFSDHTDVKVTELPEEWIQKEMVQPEK